MALLFHGYVWSSLNAGGVGMCVMAILDAVASAMRGSGTSLIDAYLFGRRVVVTPRGDWTNADENTRQLSRWVDFYVRRSFCELGRGCPSYDRARRFESGIDNRVLAPEIYADSVASTPRTINDPSAFSGPNHRRQNKQHYIVAESKP
jgi:hypothetical protein